MSVIVVTGWVVRKKASPKSEAGGAVRSWRGGIVFSTLGAGLEMVYIPSPIHASFPY
jgi:hypothetical protein